MSAQRTLPISYDDVAAAAEVLRGEIEHTPMRKSQTLSDITGAEVWLKFENLQYTGAFKERGALNRLAHLTDAEKKAGVIAMSAGNHAQGVAYHAQRLGIPATIVMPKSTPFIKVEHTRNYGANVVLFGETLVEADAHARQLEKEKGYTFIHPYDDPLVVAGQGTIAIEMLEEQPDLDTLVISVGGGGLIGGMSVAAKHINPDISIIATEPRMYPSLTAARDGKEADVGGATIAEGIAVKKIGEIGRVIAEALVDDVLLLDEAYMERGITLLLNIEKTLVEGAGAAGLGALLAYPEYFKGKKVGLVLCGGNIDTRLLASVLTRSLVREKRLSSIRIIGGDNPGLLARVSQIIGERGANIVEVSHNRIALDVPAKGAEFDILIETRDAVHTQEIVDALSEAGFPPRTEAP